MYRNTIKLGLITVGQSPRIDITRDINSLLSDKVELIEMGALDAFSLDEVNKRFAPDEGDLRLVSRMRDGHQVCFAEKYIMPLVQNCISSLESRGCSTIILMCTGKFSDLDHTSLLIKPQEVLPGLVKTLCKGQSLGLIIPSESQKTQVSKWWGSDLDLVLAAASPYGDAEELIRAAKLMKKKGIGMVFMDCMGYSLEMKEAVQDILGKNSIVILPRTMITRIVNELIN